MVRKACKGQIEYLMIEEEMGTKWKSERQETENSWIDMKQKARIGDLANIMLKEKEKMSKIVKRNHH